MGVSVINTSFKEVDHIAAALLRRQQLDAYIRPYAAQGRAWERGLAALPGLGSAFEAFLGRRVLPPPLAGDAVHEAGLMWDLAMTLSMRFDTHVRKASDSDLTSGMVRRRSAAVAAQGQRRSAQSDIVFSCWSCALEAFESARRDGRVTVLDYPIAHHRFYQAFVEEERALRPDFAATLPARSHDPVYMERLDRECELADRIIVGSNFVRDSFVAYGTDAETVISIPYGVDLELFPEPIVHEVSDDVGSLEVIFVGSIGQRKGISYLLDAMEKLDEPRISLTLIGSMVGSAEPFIPYRHLFTHIKHLAHKDCIQKFREAQAFVFPTLVEGMGLVVLEAMASGLPVVVTANGPAAVVRDGIDGFIVPIRDPDAIANRLQFLLDNPDKRREMGRNARQRALQFTWERYVEQAADAVLGL